MGELSSSKREELLNRHRRIQIHGRLKVPFCFRLFCLPILNWKATNNPPLFMPSRGRAKISFFHILERFETQSDGRVATGTYFSRSHDFPSRETSIFITLWSGLFLFLLFSRKVL